MIKGFISKFEYELLIFTFLLVKLIFLPQYIGKFLPFISAAALSFFVSFLLGKVIRGAEQNSVKIILIFIAFFLGSSVSNTVLFLNSFNVASMIYLNIFFVFCMFVAFTSASRRGEGWHIPLICFVCTAAQPLFVFIYLPAIVIVLLYEFYSSRSKENTWVLAASTAATAAALVLFRKSFEFKDNMTLKGFAKLNLNTIIYSLAIILPLVFIFSVIWISAIRACRDKKIKPIFVLIMVEPVFPFLALLFYKNFMNAVLVAMFAQFCFLAYFLYVKDKAVLAAFGKTALFFEKNLFAAVLILIYLSAFSLFKYNLLLVNRLAN